MHTSLPSPESLAFAARFSQPPGTDSGDTELARWRQMCRELLEEKERTRQEIAELTQERNTLLKSLYAATRKDIPFTRDEVFSALQRLGRQPSARS